LAGGIAHANYGGVGLAFYLGLPLLPVATVFSLFYFIVTCLDYV